MRLIRRRSWLWATFGLLVTIGLAALVVLSITALRLDAAEAAARRTAAVEENLRLALWRIDTAWAPLVAQESVRPVAGYTLSLASDFPNAALPAVPLTLAPALLADQGTGGGMAEPENGQPQRSAWQTQWPAASGPDSTPWVIVDRFEWSPHGGLMKTGTTALAAAVGDPGVGETDFQSIWRRLPPGSASISQGVDLLAGASAGDDRRSQSRSAVEFQNRSQAVLANSALVQRVNAGNAFPAAASDPAPPPLVPLWESGQMLLARRAQHRGQEVLQGCSLDWDRLRQWSLELISDLLPAASLEPVQGLGANGGPDMLAALPVRLIPGSLADFNPPRRFSVPLTLAIAWTGVLLAGAVGGVLLLGVMQLSERRAAFVSAVTHELRTPLTTFQLYTEMLSSGMVPDDATRRSYLETLRSEALRLNHLVDNVLAYARLERGRPAHPTERLTLAAVLERIKPRLEQLAQRGEMLLVVEPSEAFATVVSVNVSVVEQILLNLVDNACKYAGGSVDRRIRISAGRTKGNAELRVCDHGPGLPTGGQWLQPFSKTARQAAESSPGIGLGLALSRRLAGQIGGSLRTGAAGPTSGASWVLRLPIAR